MWHALYTLPRNLLKGGIRLYRLILSPHLGAACRFTPTCSEYALQALDKYGAMKGFVLAVHRITRCNPWGGHGYDPPKWYFEEYSEPSAERQENENPQ